MFETLRMRCVLTLIVVGTLVIAAKTTADEVVNFPDANLEALVRVALNIPEPAPIYDTNMANLDYLWAPNSNISNIGGLEYGVNMTQLILSYNPISDFSPITGMTNLTKLMLDANQISDMSMVTDLTNLTELRLNSNQISNVSAVAGLTKLKTLFLSYNQINDVSPIAALLNLDALYLHDNQISSISALSSLTNLTNLYLNNNQIVDISAVATMTKITNLHLYSNQINDISAIAGLTDLTHLSLAQNQISDITAVSELKNLNLLNLCSNQISNVSAVSELTNLNELYLSTNQISDVSAVSGLTNLTGLWLDQNQISDASAVSGLTNLTWLLLGHNQIETLNMSNSNLASLNIFRINDNPLSSVLLTNATLSQSVFDVLMDGGYSSYTGIAEIGGVTTLDMSGVEFWDSSDLSAMYTMDDLETLLLAGATNLDGSQVVTLTEELDSLNWLDVTGLWGSFDEASQGSLIAWDAEAGNTLVIPEPAAIVLLLCGLLAGLIRWKKW